MPRNVIDNSATAPCTGSGRFFAPLSHQRHHLLTTQQAPVNQPYPLMRLADRNRDDKMRMIERTLEQVAPELAMRLLQIRDENRELAPVRLSARISAERGPAADLVTFHRENEVCDWQRPLT
jgi:hypothetical protein